MATRRKSKQPPQQISTPPSRVLSDSWLYFALLVLIVLVYAQVRTFDFVSYDDPDYVTNNPVVKNGITLAGLRWALTSSFAGNWFPLTWFSHMLDYTLFGMNSGLHHLTSVLIHALTALVCFVVFAQMTGARWMSAMVAFLFALHPMHVESVAWIAERKDVLSALFEALTLWVYLKYSLRPTASRYISTLVVFCLGLMAKPMLVTVPLLLVLIDFWPLRRGLRLVEKLPFLALSLAVSVVTYVVHKDVGAAVSLELIPTSTRLANAVVSYWIYLYKALVPLHLAVFYPYPTSFSPLPTLAAALFLGLLTAACVWQATRRPYLLVGWLWYLISLLPVIGIIQVGSQAYADRYSYLPLMGIFVALVWTAADLLRTRPWAATTLANCVGVACLSLTWLQIQYWRNSISLYQHAIEVTTDNYVARYNLAAVDEARGDLSAAEGQLQETVRIRPFFVVARSAFGQVLAEEGKHDRAVEELKIAETLKPSDPDTHFRLGASLGALGRIEDAISEFSSGLRLRPDDIDAHYNLGLVQSQGNRFENAAREFKVVVDAKPADIGARYNLAIAFARTGHVDEAVAQLSEVLRQDPNVAEARNTLDDLKKMNLRQK